MAGGSSGRKTGQVRSLDGGYESEEDAEFDKLLGIVREPEKTQSEANMSTDAPGLALSQETAEAAENQATLGTSPARKRTRSESSPSGRESSAKRPDTSNNPSFPSSPFGQDFQSAVTSSKQTSDLLSLLQPAAPSIPRQELDAIRLFSESLEQLANQPESSNIPRMNAEAVGSNSSPGAHEQDDVNISSPSRNIAEQAPTQPRRSIRRRTRHGPQELTAFPPFEEELPPGLSLEALCHDYPNHLSGRYLRQFIDEGWTARRIWAAMQDSAKGSVSITRPWNKLEHRLLKEKRLMAQEQENSPPAYKVDPHSDPAQSAPTPNTGMDVGMHAPGMDAGTHAPGMDVGVLDPGIDAEIRARGLDAEIHAPGMDFPAPAPGRYIRMVAGGTDAGLHAPGANAATQAPGFAVPRVEGLQNSFMAELRKQKSILSLLLSAEDPEWNSKSQQEKSQRIEEEWIRRARRLEGVFAVNHGLDVDDLEIEQTSMSGLLRRFNILLKSLQIATLGAENREAALLEQLDNLREWTVQWHEQLEERTELIGGRANEQASSLWFPSAGRSTEYRPAWLQAAPSIVHPQTQNVFSTATGISSLAQSRPAQTQVAVAQGLDVFQNVLPPVPRIWYQQHQYVSNRLQHSGPNLHPLQYAAPEFVSPGAGNVAGLQDRQQNLSGQNPATETRSDHTAPETDEEFSFQQFLESDDVSLTQWHGEELQDDD